MQRVAITGIGIVSCLGSDPDTVAAALRGGTSGIVVDEERVRLGFRSPLTGRLRGFDPRGRLTRKQAKTMPDFAVQAWCATQDALAMSGLGQDEIRSDRTGLVFGCDSTAVAAVEQVARLRETGDTTLIGSGQIFRAMNSTVTMNLNVLLGTRGASWTISSACSSSGHAIGQGADLIRLGRQDRVICGGAQEITWESICSFDGLGAFSLRTDDPEGASRPFDADRDGLVPGGGAAALVLENFDQAKARGATILGEVAGYAFSSDGEHISRPSGRGIGRAMAGALADSGLAPADIDWICAHATSTPAGDAAEAEAIAALFGPTTPPVTALKSMTGHELWMSGASQAVYAAIMAREGFTAGTRNFRRPEEGAARINVLAETRPEPPRRALLNAAGFGGTNSCLVLRFDSRDAQDAGRTA